MDSRRILDEADLDGLLAAPRSLLFKHSPICPTSARAFGEYRRWLAGGARIETAWLDVIEQRPLSLAVAERTGVRHESPQVLLFEGGRVRWHASHGAITRESLEEHVGGGA